MRKPCGHYPSKPECGVCLKADTVPAYMELFKNPLQDGPPVCKFRGRSLSQEEKADNDLDQLRNYVECLSLRKPLGMFVCECAGCGPLCPDFVRDTANEPV